MDNQDIDHLKARARGISLGLYAADLGALGAAVDEAGAWGCQIAHFDEMDGSFVPAMVGGAGFVKAAGGAMLRDVHLMVARPSAHVAAYVQAGADIITVHAEAPDAAAAIDAIRTEAAKAGRAVLAGLGVMPGTNLDGIDDLLNKEPDLILVLSLDPREGTSPDILTACGRLAALRGRTAEFGAVMAFDGGVTRESVNQIAACAPDMIVSGSAVLRADNPKAVFAEMQAAWQNTRG